MPKGNLRPTVAQDFDIEIEPSGLPYYLITDGRISYSTLKELNKNKEWLMKKLNFENEKKIKNVILAIYDKEQDKIMVNYKDE